MTQGTERSAGDLDRDAAASAGEEAEPRDLAAELAALQAKHAELEARLLRAQADYQNLRRRTQTDADNAVQRSLQGILEGLLLVLDHLDLALGSTYASEDARALIGGVRLTRDQLALILERQEVHALPETARFDPTRHEAVATVTDTSVAPGDIVDTVRRGYTWRGRVLRAAHVRVAAAPPAPPSEAAE